MKYKIKIHGWKVKDLRKSNKMTRRKFAEIMHCTENAAFLMEKKNIAQKESINLLAAWFDMNPSYFIK
jgi:transcriptional regulator with XRE-family HTH domain